MSKLRELRPSRGARKRRKRLGTGPGSGHGGTSTKGHKGQKARSGGRIPPWFEGGQMPLQRRVPKRGFVRRGHVEYQVVNLAQLARFDPSTEVTLEALYEKRLIRKRTVPVKILGMGEVTTPFRVRVHAVSKTAREKLEKAGGAVELIS